MDTSDPPGQGRDGLYNLLVQILGLLNPGAWLPAVFGLGGLTLLLEFREMRAVDLPRALRTVLDAVVAVSQSAVTAALVVLPTLAVAAMITQSFSHVATRFLQGHWAPRPGLLALRRMLVRRQIARKRRLEARRKNQVRDLQERAGTPDEAPSGDAERRARAAPEEAATVEHWLEEESAYPAEARMLPTKLGNILRRTEDRISAAGPDTGVVRRPATVPSAVDAELDQARTLLEMYCTLVFVAALLALATPVALTGLLRSAAPAVTVLVLVFAGISALSYQAAIASARRYCFLLEAVAGAAPPGGGAAPEGG